MIEEAALMGPNVIVVNMAFHWFQLCGYSEKMCPDSKDAPIILRWLNYRETWLQRVYDFALQSGATLLLFKTANFICGEARTGDWLEGDRLYSSFDGETIAKCASIIEPIRESVGLSDDDILRYCRYAQFTDVGSRYLNRQMEDFVEEVRSEAFDSGLVVGMYNDHAIESCETTEDAIHHKIGMVSRIRLLTNTIDSYINCTISPKS